MTNNLTTEFIAELRKDYCGYGCNPSICMCSLAEEAADLIEQLSAELKYAANEIERLRKALRDLYDACELRANREGGDLGPDIGPAAYAALEALGDQPNAE
jgi:hypothetical protein